MSDRDPLDPDYLDAVPESRRNFIKKMAAVAFVAPVVGSFTMDSVAFAGSAPYLPNQTFPNQTTGNQTFPNQTTGNQTFPNQRTGNQTFPNQRTGNQTFPPGHKKKVNFARNKFWKFFRMWNW
jgi:hypothetical protein